MNTLAFVLLHIAWIPSVSAAGCGAAGCIHDDDVTNLMQTNLKAISREDGEQSSRNLAETDVDAQIYSDLDSTTFEEEMHLADQAASQELKQESELKLTSAQEDAKLYQELEAELGTGITEADMRMADELTMQDAGLQSLMHAEQFALAAQQLEDGTTKELFKSFEICGQCNNFKRFGEPHDGGYLMCMDELNKGNTLAALSLGVEHHDQWSEDVIKNLNIPVHQFDCTVSGSDCKACTFHKKCIDAADGLHPVPKHENEGWSLRQALEETGMGNAPEASLLMKMDIEGSEWPIYANEPAEELKKVGQLIVEFHNVQNEFQHAEMLQAMKHIQKAGFKVAHLHGNNFQPLYWVGGLSLPQVIEVTFLHGKSMSNGCLKDQVYRQGLDAENKEGYLELPMAHMAE